MPTAASGAQLLLPPLASQKPKVPLLALRSPRRAVNDEVPCLAITPREDQQAADKSREFIETIATPRFHDDMESRYTNNVQTIASLPFSELLDVICHFSLPDKAEKSYLKGVDLSEEEFYIQPQTRRRFNRNDAIRAKEILAAELTDTLSLTDAEAFFAMNEVEDPDTDELGLPLWTVLAKRPMADIRATDGIDDDLTRHLFKEYMSMRNQEMASDQVVHSLPVTAVMYKRPMNKYMSHSRRIVMDHMRKSLNLLQDGFRLETRKCVRLAPAPPPMLTKEEISAGCHVRAAQHEMRKKLAEQRRDESDAFRLEALRKKKEIHDLKMKVFSQYGISLRTIQARWLPAVYLASVALFLANCMRNARFMRVIMKRQVRMAIAIQRFFRAVQKKRLEEARKQMVFRASLCIRKSWYLFKLQRVGLKKRNATNIIKQFLEEVKKTNILRKSVGLYRKRIIQVQRFVRRVMRVFNARVGLMIASMNNASLKFKKDLAIKRDTSKASKKAAAGKDKTAVQAEKQSATQVVDKVDKGVRRASLVTFDDSKVVYEKTFSMWMILDKFSRAKVCERVLQKLYRSHRMAVKEYSTKILPKWEAWRAAQDIRDSVKSYITDASSRSSRSQSIISSGTMAAPDNDASSRSSRSKSFISSGTMAAPEYPRLRWLHPAQSVQRLIGVTILEVLPAAMFVSGPPQPTSGKGVKPSPRKK